MKKKLFILAAVGCMTLSLVGCGNSGSTESTTASAEANGSTQTQAGFCTITVNTSSGGMVAYAAEGAEIKFDEDFPAQSLNFPGTEGATYVLEAKANPEREGMQFVKWKKDGSDYSKDAKITITASGNAEYYAVFEDPNAEFEGSYDYLVLVNKTHKLPDDWEANVVLEEATNRYGETYKVEKKALEQFLKLQKELADEGIYIELDSTTRSVAEQQKLWDDWTVEKGEDYVKKYVAVPGYSEHHTGLAIDVCLDKDGKRIDDNDEMIAEKEIFAKVHEKLAKYGFILRYLDGKDAETGYSYEPWHFRYIDDPDKAKEIMDKGITLEAYLGELN